MKTKRMISLMLSGIMLMVALSGCDGGGTASPGSFTPAEEQKGQITLWSWDTAAPSLARSFEQQYSDIKVDVTVVPDYYTKITQVLATGVDVPDVIMVESSYYGEFANSIALENLGDAPYNAKDMKDQFYSFWYENGVGIDGVLRVMPNSPGMGAFFYRRDIVEQLFGSGEPEVVEEKLSDWDKMYEAGVKLKAETGKFIVSSANTVYASALNQTGEPVVKDGKVNTKIFTEALNIAKKFRQAGIDAKQADGSPELAAGLVGGQVLGYVYGSWGEKYVIEAAVGDSQDGLWGVAAVPGGTYSNGGNGFAIPTEAKNKDMAWAFIKFITTDMQTLKEQLDTNSNYPAFIAATKDEFFSQPVKLFKGQPARQKYGQLAQDIILLPRTKYDSSVHAVMSKYTEDVFNGQLSVEEAVDMMNREVCQQFQELSR